MSNKKIKVDLVKELQSSIIPSSSEIDNILKDFKGEELDEETDTQTKATPKITQDDMKLACKGKRFNPEFRSYSNLQSFALTHTSGLINEKNNFMVSNKPHSTAPVSRTKSYIPKSAEKILNRDE